MTRTTVDLVERCLACEAGKNGAARLRNYIRLSRSGLLRLTQSVRLCGAAEPWSMVCQDRGAWLVKGPVRPLSSLVSRRGIESSATLITAFGLSGASPTIVPSLASEAALQGVGTKRPGADHVCARFYDSVSR